MVLYDRPHNHSCKWTISKIITTSRSLKVFILVLFDMPHDFILVFCCNYASVLYRFWYIITCLPEFQTGFHDLEHNSFRGSLSLHVLVLITVDLHTKFEMPGFSHSKYRYKYLLTFLQLENRIT